MIRYAKSGDVHVAYEVIEEGPRDLDLVLVPGFVSHLEAGHEEPSLARFLRRLSSFSRLILFDKRGTGLSDRGAGLPTFEERMDDIRAVMDAAGSERAAFLGVSEGGPLTLLFAASYPERVHAMALYGTCARAAWAPDNPAGIDPAAIHELAARLEEGWGTGVALGSFAPSLAEDVRFRQWWARFQRLAASPSDARAVIESIAAVDVRHVLPVVTAPALVLHRSGDRLFSVELGRRLAEGLPNGRFVELPGADHVFFTDDQDALLDEVEEFLTGTRSASEPERVLATVLFTDIVESTQRAAALGDRRWSDLLESHRAIVRRELDRFRGREVDNAGDGFFATFDGPARAVRCAAAIRDAVSAAGVEVRTGVHTGECELTEGGVAGIAVHTGARISALAEPGEVLVSSTVKDLVAGSGISFEERGVHVLKGVPGEWGLYRVKQT